ANASVSGQLIQKDKDKTVELFQTVTDTHGSADVTFPVPEDLQGQYELTLQVKTDKGTETIRKNVTVVAKDRIYLTSDKPVYQPGQLMHVRALVLRAADWKPVFEKSMTLEIADGKGNKVFKKQVNTSNYGIVSAEFQLADEVNEGAYTISAILEDRKEQKVVTVKQYVLPKFKIDVESTRDYYTPGEKITGKLKCAYFFGKPIADGTVKISASCFDVGFNEFETFEGKTNAEGQCEFAMTIPDKLVAQDSFKGTAMVRLQIKVRDGADHEEEKYHIAHVAQAPIQVELIPESGKVVPGVENAFYLVASYPDGSAATPELRVSLSGDNLKKSEKTAQADDKGLATVAFEIPKDSSRVDFTIQAKDTQGNEAKLEKQLEITQTNYPMMVRTDAGTYQVGDTMMVEILCPEIERETVFVDVIKNDQTALTKSIDLEHGKGTLPISLDQNLFGTLAIHGYRILPNGEMAGDTRKVVVNRRDDLAISMKPDKEEYLPGEPAQIAVQVTDSEGKGTSAALGIDVVDESVFALAEKEPGLAKVFFTIEKELLDPKYEIHGFSFGELVRSVRRDRDWLEKAATVSLAKDDVDLQYSLREFTGDTFLNNARTTVLQLANALSGINKESRKEGPVESILYPRVQLADARMFVDPWGGAYRLALLNQNEIVRSAGPDHTFDTPDDIQAPVQPYDSRRRRAGRAGGEAIFLGEQVQMMDMGVRAAFGPGEGPAKWEVGRIEAGAPKAAGKVMFENVWNMSEARAKGAPVRADADGLSMSAESLDKLQSVNGLGYVDDAKQPAATLTERVYIGFDISRDEQETGTMVVNGYGAQHGASTTLRQKPQDIRVRSYFPELLYTNPSMVTDENGKGLIALNMADSITTWRMTALANSQAGKLGSGESNMKSFQPFFIDLDLPIALTKDDEVTIPVAVHNYLPGPQTVQVQLEEAKWFDLMKDSTKKTVEIAPNDVGKVEYRIRAKDLGKNRITVFGWSEEKEDAVARDIEVRPNGEEQFATVNGRLTDQVSHTLEFPATALPGASKILLRVYPGIFSQVVEGLDSIMQMPYGCFEQTSSITYPNILVLDYMKRTEQVTPEIEMKAREYINLGYQRLLTFEIDGGGFEVFGNPPATRVLTAYGLLEFSDMNKVYPIDERLIPRTQEWLAGEQKQDGSWEPDKTYSHSEMWQNIQNNPPLVTAFIAWGMGESGYRGDALNKARDYLKREMANAKDSYTLAMMANAFAAADPKCAELDDLLKRLKAQAVETRDTIKWPSEASLSFAHGEVATIETTALVAIAMIKQGGYPQDVGKALNYLIQQKDPNGTWHSTHATVLALKAMILSLGNATEEMEGTVVVKVDGKSANEIKITPDNCDVVRLVNLGVIENPGNHQIELELKGDGSILYQIVGSYFVPWGKEGKVEPLSIAVNYDRTQLERNETVTCKVTARNNTPRRAEMVILDLGIPPGFTAEREALDNAVKAEKIAKYTLTGRQATIYLRFLDTNSEFSLDIPMKARLMITAKTPESKIYEYYNPEVNGYDMPEELNVR
ncbi:MAG TPA: MG2 domain-containing protein, partial [bacterium]|nr:MG2 domain-containing protein [bacterium]